MGNCLTTAAVYISLSSHANMEQPAWMATFLTDKQATKKLAIIGLH